MHRFISIVGYLGFCVVEFMATDIDLFDSREYVPKAADYSGYYKPFPLSALWRSTASMVIVSLVMLVIFGFAFHKIMGNGATNHKVLFKIGLLLSALIFLSTIFYTYILSRDDSEIDLFSMVLILLAVILEIICFVFVIKKDNFRWFMLGIILQSVVITWVSLISFGVPMM